MYISCPLCGQSDGGELVWCVRRDSDDSGSSWLTTEYQEQTCRCVLDKGQFDALWDKADEKAAESWYAGEGW